MYFIHRHHSPQVGSHNWYIIQFKGSVCPLDELKEWLMLNAGADWDYDTLIHETDFRIVGFKFYVKNAKIAMLFKLTFC